MMKIFIRFGGNGKVDFWTHYLWVLSQDLILVFSLSIEIYLFKSVRLEVSFKWKEFRNIPTDFSRINGLHITDCCV